MDTLKCFKIMTNKLSQLCRENRYGKKEVYHEFYQILSHHEDMQPCFFYPSNPHDGFKAFLNTLTGIVSEDPDSFDDEWIMSLRKVIRRSDAGLILKSCCYFG